MSLIESTPDAGTGALIRLVDAGSIALQIDLPLTGKDWSSFTDKSNPIPKKKQEPQLALDMIFDNHESQPYKKEVLSKGLLFWFTVNNCLALLMEPLQL